MRAIPLKGKEWSARRRNLFLLYFGVYFFIPTILVLQTIDDISPWFVDADNDFMMILLVLTGIYAFVYTLRHWPSKDIEMLKLFLPYVTSLVLAVCISGAESLQSVFILHGFVNLLGLWIAVSLSVIAHGFAPSSASEKIMRLFRMRLRVYHPFWLAAIVFVCSLVILAQYIRFELARTDISPYLFVSYVVVSIALITATHYTYSKTTTLFKTL